LILYDFLTMKVLSPQLQGNLNRMATVRV
jgi:hypothetical protein